MFTVTTHTVSGQDSRHWQGPAYEAAMTFTKGLEQLGSGLFSRVFGNDATPFVVKVGKMSDAGYLSYLETIRELEIENPFIPHIIDVHYFRHVEDEYKDLPQQSYFVVRMEKLSKGDVKDAWAFEGGTQFQQTCRMIQMAAEQSLLDVGVTSEFEDAIALLQIAKERVAEKFSVRFDLHSGNIMLRGNQLVITDPIA